MQVRSFLRRAIPFIAALSIGVTASWLLVEREVPDSNAVSVREMRRFPPELPGGAGSSGPDSGTSEEAKPPPCSGTCNVKILSKRRANYTDAARQNNVQGDITLRVTFLASGEIGGITAVSGLPYGLTEQAIAAAREIKFTPATKNGIPYTKQMTLQYGFTIY